jgi:hypothetical protein
MAVDDMTANEAAFVGMRSAAVTKGSVSKRKEEAESRIKNYMFLYYPSTYIDPGAKLIGSFGFSDKETVAPYYENARNADNENQSGFQDEEAIDEDAGEAVTIWQDSGKKFKNYSGSMEKKSTLKLYYFTRVMFGSLTGGGMAKRKLEDILYKRSGSRRYASARSRMLFSPDQDYYDKAYPGAKKFDE